MKNLTLNDIAGYEEEKAELRMIINMFKNYEHYKDNGAYLSKGLIISGEPGVSKTLFAKVLANELGAPFYYLDGSETTGKDGVKQIKNLFKSAQKNTPSVIFIDELNTFIGDYDYQSDFTKRNLSTLLKLIDGVKGNEGVFVIGATSNKEGLDSAILRSGRMDRHICLDNPNSKSRLEILNYYLNKISLDSSNINKKDIIEKTKGFNGSDLKALVNEATLNALSNHTMLSNDLFDSFIRRIKNSDIDRDVGNFDIALSAVHAISHLIVARELLHQYNEISFEHFNSSLCDNCIDFIFEEHDDDDDEYDYDDDERDVDICQCDSKETILNKIAILLASSAGEEVIFQTKFMDLSQDISSASFLIYQMFDNGFYGMKFTSKKYYLDEDDISQNLLAEYEKKRTEILDEQLTIAKQIIEKYKEKILILRNRLIKTKTLTQDFVENTLRKNSK